MARPSTITRDEVFAAIRGLIEAGEYPNPANVRRQLDGRGSPPLVQRLIGLWYAEHGPELAHKAAAKPQKSPVGGLQAELKRLTTTALEEVEAAQATRIAELDARDAGLKGREADLLGREEAQDARELAHAELLLDLREQLRAMKWQLRRAHAREGVIDKAHLAQAQAFQAAADAREAEMNRLRALAEQLPAQQAAAERAQADAAREQARVAELVGERDRLQRLASERAAELAKVKGVLERADAAAATQNAGLATLRQQLQEAQIELSAAAARGQALANDLEKALAGRREDAERIDGLRRAAIDADKAQAVLLSRLEAAQGDLARAESVVAGLESLREAVGLLSDRIPQDTRSAGRRRDRSNAAR